MKLLYIYFWKRLPTCALIWLAPIWLTWAQIAQPTSNHLKRDRSESEAWQVLSMPVDGSSEKRPVIVDAFLCELWRQVQFDASGSTLRVLVLQFMGASADDRNLVIRFCWWQKPCYSYPIIRGYGLWCRPIILKKLCGGWKPCRSRHIAWKELWINVCQEKIFRPSEEIMFCCPFNLTPQPSGQDCRKCLQLPTVVVYTWVHMFSVILNTANLSNLFCRYFFSQAWTKLLLTWHLHCLSVWAASRETAVFTNPICNR